MKTVHKFIAKHNAIIMINHGFQRISFGSQAPELALWVEVDTDRHPEKWRFIRIAIPNRVNSANLINTPKETICLGGEWEAETFDTNGDHYLWFLEPLDYTEKESRHYFLFNTGDEISHTDATYVGLLCNDENTKTGIGHIYELKLD